MGDTHARPCARRAARRRVTWQHLAEERYPTPNVEEQLAQVVGNVVIKQKRHTPVDDICRATTTSSSPR